MSAADTHHVLTCGVREYRWLSQQVNRSRKVPQMTAFMLDGWIYDNASTIIRTKEQAGIYVPVWPVNCMCEHDSPKMCVHPDYGWCQCCIDTYEDYVRCSGEMKLKNYKRGESGLIPLTIHEFGMMVFHACSHYPMTVGRQRKLFFDRAGKIIVCDTKDTFMAALQARVGIIRMRRGLGYFTKSELIAWLKMSAKHWDFIDEYVAYRDANAIPELSE